MQSHKVESGLNPDIQKTQTQSNEKTNQIQKPKLQLKQTNVQQHQQTIPRDYNEPNSKGENIKGGQQSYKLNSQQQDKLEAELMEFGFEQQYIRMALKYTSDKQQAAQIIVKLLQEGINADLSEYLPKKHIKENIQKKKLNKPKMLFIVNGELKMGKGKVCAQVGHAVIGAYLQIEEIARFDQKAKIALDAWEYSGGAKIVVRAQNLKQLQEVKKRLDQQGINTHLVVDAGHTQIKAGSKTVLAVGPAFSEDIDPITQHLKLL